MTDDKVVVDKSTVPVGTADKVTATINEELSQRFVIASDARQSMPSFSVVSNPEFLKEGAAVEDFTRPDRIVLGVANDAAGQQALATMRQLYAPFNRNHERTRVMDVKCAEFTKYAANAMLATRISLMNELANLAETVGADIELVRQGIGSDPRIGYSFLYAGTGYGGSCFPKDVQALARTAREHGQTLRNKTFALWGLAFKPNTNDMRDAPSRVIVQALLRAGARARPGRRARAAAQPAICQQTHASRAGRRRADHRHRMESLPQPQLDGAEGGDECAGDF